ncbi:bifunctional [glutamine synthetase] adenylyltransferase/[glutamine synthetase]-adenylyl-L-tyrosine phosphorylase [Aureimonas glaciei]|uniref:Bifunctional glutamine synthetase adenylyltransferase/adenylyl-removing enzyme n=1 Tax=Aureimonas glaciei TaxID=1776957 RepID=A0A916XUB5_9HYPH|nr:bifunctional [glutamine synthetase] adenylyltransferase/[glutamine synthetase]-adenylyl-L-tyrosine phosphorylase [Aureimonas glaciei]GGD12707.1 glutamate-ammonia-ligase adenylyltransferase [Aureimonas glaciei]
MNRSGSPPPPGTDAAADAAALKIGGTARLVPLDAGKAEAWLADLARRAEAEDCPRLLALLARTGDADRARLGAVLDLSSHLNAVMLSSPDFLERLFDTEPRARIAEIIASLGTLPVAGASESETMALLRQAKREVALLVALRELFGAADGRETTADLSDLAEGAVGAAVRFALLDLHNREKLALPDPAHPEKGCGLFVLGMGKLGGRELNYSSDIDLIVFFDPDVAAIPDPDEAVEMFSKLVRRLIRMIGERTGDGYVFRTDLRLRPDPGAMPLAIPVPAAITYYEASGRNWERAAMIKARVVAGDAQAGAAFLDEITPFVWRKYLDFAAIAEIQSMKDRIDRHRGFDGIGVAGHNVKLGPGGIREVEFFAQTQQLIAGGRAPELRLRRTEETLSALAGGGWITPGVATELTGSYWFLRRVEHAIQMVADEQTHTLPEDAEGLERVARLSGFADLAGFSESLLPTLTRVEALFSSLFAQRTEPDDALPKVGGFLGGEDEAGVAAYLAGLGFQRPGDIARILRGWGAGRVRATRAEATRRQLAIVLPALLEAFAKAEDPDAAMAAFDGFVSRLPAGLQFFSLLASNPRLLDLLALVISAAPRLAETISHRPHVFDALLDPAFYREVPTADLMAERLSAFLADSDGYEERLVRLRLFASEQKFLVGARLLSGAIEGEVAGAVYSAIADVVLAAAFDAVEKEFARVHGTVPGGRAALLGMGRLGSHELTEGSDVDLLLLYDHDEGAEESVGARPLATTTYYSRLTQRLIAALTAPMGEGILYEVDFRLRPSGNKGPLATHLGAFRRYQENEAWTWERMALTRSRPIAGDASMQTQAEATVREILALPRDPVAMRQDVAAMRARIARDKPARGALDLKLIAGGLIDLEFIAQWAILAGHVPPALIGRPTAEVLRALEVAGVLPNGNFPLILGSSADAYTRIIQLTRLGPGHAHTVEALPRGLSERVAEALGLASPEAIEPTVATTAAAVNETFTRLLPMDREDGV